MAVKDQRQLYHASAPTGRPGLMPIQSRRGFWPFFPVDRDNGPIRVQARVDAGLAISVHHADRRRRRVVLGDVPQGVPDGVAAPAFPVPASAVAAAPVRPVPARAGVVGASLAALARSFAVLVHDHRFAACRTYSGTADARSWAAAAPKAPDASVRAPCAVRYVRWRAGVAPDAEALGASCRRHGARSCRRAIPAVAVLRQCVGLGDLWPAGYPVAAVVGA